MLDRRLKNIFGSKIKSRKDKLKQWREAYNWKGRNAESLLEAILSTIDKEIGNKSVFKIYRAMITLQFSEADFLNNMQTVPVGSSWTTYKEGADIYVSGSKFDYLGLRPGKQALLTATAHISAVDVYNTVLNRASYPQEKELTMYDDVKINRVDFYPIDDKARDKFLSWRTTGKNWKPWIDPSIKPETVYKYQGQYVETYESDVLEPTYITNPRADRTDTYLFDSNPRIPKKYEGQDPSEHSDLYTDEDPIGTIQGLGFKDKATAEKSIRLIKNSGKTHAHKIQAAMAMEQRARFHPHATKGIKDAQKIYAAFIEEMKKKTKRNPPWAVFIVGKVGDKYAATTRDDGRIGLPGGKVDVGESGKVAVMREATEEGWSFPKETNLTLIHQQDVEGNPIDWYMADTTPSKLSEYKEKHRGIKPILITEEELRNSGFGNENLPLHRKNPMAPGYQSYSWTTEDWRSIKVNNKGEIDYKEKCGAEGTQTPDGSPRLCLPVEVIRSLLRTESGKDVIRTQARKKARAKKGERVPWHPRIKKIWKRVKEQSPKDKKNPNHIKISHYPDPDPEAEEGMMRIDLHEGGDNVGFLLWSESDGVVHINYLNVKRSHRRKGLGKLLLDEFGKMHKGKKIQLHAPLGKPRAWIPEWYQRYGFKLVESDSNLMALQNPGWRHGEQMEDDPFAEYFEENVEGDENTTTV
jgi:ribosomal protein S18 acetylase RimI-like enzyme